MARPRIHIVTFTDEQVKELKRKMRSTKTGKTLKGRIQILLLLDTAHNKEYSYEVIGKKSGTSLSSVRKVVKEYAEGGLERVLHINRNPKSDTANKKMDGRAEAEIIKIACGPCPEGHARWTLRLLAEQAKVVLDEPVSKDTIGRALKKIKFDLTKTPTGVSPRKDPENS